jgi:integrase
MGRTRSGSHLRRVADTWYYRRAVPGDVRAEFKRSEITVSLGTTSRVEAERLEKEHDVAFAKRLREARTTDKDGFSKDPKLRLEQLTQKYFDNIDDDDPDPETAMDMLPVRDQILVERQVEELADEQLDRDYEVDGAVIEISEKLKEILPWVGDISSTKPGLIEVIKQYISNLQSEYTIGWAYESWKNIKKRPDQTNSEARRYLDQFCAHTGVRTLSEIHRFHILKWRDYLQESNNFQTKTVNHHLELVCAILRQGWRDAEMPPPDLTRTHLPEPLDTHREPWSREDILRALRALEPRSWSAWMFVIALTTGTRIGEPTAARKEWYDPNGFIRLPAQFTKSRKRRVLPVIELIRPALEKHAAGLENGVYLFDAPRPSNKKLKIAHEASKWFGRFFNRNGIDKVFHELRHTWKEAARISPIKKEIHDIISGHARTNMGDWYGGASSSELVAANETVCAGFLDGELRTEIKRLLG